MEGVNFIIFLTDMFIGILDSAITKEIGIATAYRIVLRDISQRKP